MFDESFIEERRRGLESFINKFVVGHGLHSAMLMLFTTRVAGHPLAQNEISLHMFLQVLFTLFA
jgi:sorting nexin-3/12